MPSTYIPRGDLGVRDWAAAFAANLAADPARFGRTAGEAALVQSLVDDFAARLTAATDPMTRTAASVFAKSHARAALLAGLRPLAQRIRLDGRVGDADKRVLGLVPVPRSYARVPPPATAPRVFVSVAAPCVHSVRFADPANPARRAKPPGVDGMQLFVAFTDAPRDTAPPPTPDAAAYRAFITRQCETITHPPTLDRHVAHYFARWQNTRGQVGPWSAVTSLGIAG